MQDRNYITLDSSVLYRCNQKYYDKLLADYSIGYTQMLLLTQVYEREGISMNELAISGSFDKGTITKSIQKLEQLGYIELRSSDLDKRSKLLYTTVKARDFLPKLYVFQQDWFNYLSSELSEEEKESYGRIMTKLIEKARTYNETHFPVNNIKIFGLQKLTMLDYPNHVAATVFTGGCNFRCPFCHNRSLVFLNEANQEIPEEDIIDYLDKRQGILDGVCITGGEPLLQEDLKPFIRNIKEKGLKVKLDTNGTNCEKLKELVDEGLIDYVAMDIKNCKEKYGITVGQNDFKTDEVEKTVKYLLEGHVDYEFRTTVVKQFHNKDDFLLIGKWIQGAKAYYLQNFEDQGECIAQGLSALDVDELKEIKELLVPYVKHIEIRGIKE